MESLYKNKTWDLVKLPKCKKTVCCKWVFKKKEGTPRVEEPRYKSRLVAKGYNKIPGVDFTNVFSPVVKHSSIRALLGIMAMHDLELEQLDVKTIFFHGELEADSYMQQPEGFTVSEKEDYVCLLKKSLYGLKQSPRQWYKSNKKEIIKMKKEAMSKPKALTHDIFPKTQPHIYSWIKKYGKNFVYWNGIRVEVVISEPELVKEVLKNSENVFPKVKPSIYVSKLLGNGLATIDGEKWVKHRKQGKEIEVYQEFRLLTSEVISRTAFGSNYLEGEKIFAMLNNKLWKPADLLESEELAKEIKDCVIKIVKKREDKAVNGEADSFDNNFLGLLINAYHDSDENNRLSLEDLVGECKTFYWTGHDTINALLAWTLLLLVIHVDWQETPRREVIDIFGNQNPHLKGIAKLKTMTMIIYETLRLYGAINGLPRKVTREVQVGKLALPASIDLLIARAALHHDPQLWGDDVHLFKPERFAEGIAKATNYNAAAFFPFGLGPRFCVVMTFATTETKIALSMILQRYTIWSVNTSCSTPAMVSGTGCYTITLSPAYVHSPIPILTLHPEHGIEVILESLHNDT
ncbi:hypothetical protein V6Z11_A02G029800 [Gossypium hirsutum]